MPEIGDKAPDFTLMALDDSTYTLSQMAGKVELLVCH